MHLLRASSLIVTECGPTMYQPKFGPLDRVTLTTHPYVVAISRRVIEMLLGRKIKILTPFENLTKAEVMALLRGADEFTMTHSCISQRFGGHDGTCYGCIVRRLAALAADVTDVEYRKDPLLDEQASRDNLLGLLRFSLDYLADWRNMEEYEVGEIDLYHKTDLFRRFALDNFAAIHPLVVARAPVAGDVRRIYGYALEALGGSRQLVDRMRDLREARFSPTWVDRSLRRIETPILPA
jgi:Queuosine biosynthesis protein QueC